MLTPLDELMCHQLPTTLDHPLTSDRDWTERIYMSAYDVVDQQLMIGVGLGQYPNRDVQDGFVCVWNDGQQHNLRLSRALRPSPHLTAIGPFRVEVLEGLRRLRFVLDENESDLAMDFVWEATLAPHEEEPDFRRSRGRIVQHINRFDQMGRLDGWVQVGGKRHALSPERHWSHRDRSWGQRRPLRTERGSAAAMRFRPLLFSWGVAQFDSWGIHWRFVDRGAGRYSYISGEHVGPMNEEQHTEGALESVTHELRWSESSPVQTLLGGEMTLNWESGRKETLVLETQRPRWHLRGGGYGDYRGFAFGSPRGALHLEHDVWDLRDADVLLEASTLSDHLIRFEGEAGIGWGIMEYGVGTGFERYQEVQHLATF